MDEEQDLTQQLETARLAISDWSHAYDPATLAVVLVLVALVMIFRRGLAKLLVDAGLALLRHLGAPLGDKVRDKFIETAEVLVVALACYILLVYLDPPEIAGGLLERLIVSVAVVAVFSAWYGLAAPFVSLLFASKISERRIEKDWVVRVSQFAIALFGLTALLKVWEIDISGALTGVGVLGAALALAAQDLIRNLVAGMSNLGEDRFETGDTIEVPGMFIGTVKRVDLRSTLIVGLDQIPRHVPNSEIANSVVMNYSRMKHRRVLMNVPLVLSTTKAQTEAVKAGVVDFIEQSGLFDVSADSTQFVSASHISEHAIEILIIVMTKTGDYGASLDASEALNLRVMELVAEAGTEFAYPTQTLVTRPSPADPGPIAVG